MGMGIEMKMGTEIETTTNNNNEAFTCHVSHHHMLSEVMYMYIQFLYDL